MMRRIQVTSEGQKFVIVQHEEDSFDVSTGTYAIKNVSFQTLSNWIQSTANTAEIYRKVFETLCDKLFRVYKEDRYND